jgi:hypothetical protein
MPVTNYLRADLSHSRFEEVDSAGGCHKVPNDSAFVVDSNTGYDPTEVECDYYTGLTAWVRVSRG